MKIVPGLRTLALLFCCTLCLLVSFFCAGQVAPSGGPPDTTPPKIVKTYPQSAQLHFRDDRIVLEFDKYVDRRSVEQSIFFSPSIGRAKFGWSGKEIEIRFTDTLRANTTYIVTIGTDVIDTRRNKMANAFSLAFSTGGHIDSASVSGKVFDPKPTGIMIFAYGLDDRRPDTLNPARTGPDYLTQTGADGSFNLTNLAYGSYRLFAVRDQFRNLIYDIQTDQIGMAAQDVFLSLGVQHVGEIQFRLTSEDTTSPFLSSVRTIDRNHLLLRFSEGLDTTGITSRNVTIVDTISRIRLEVRDLSFVDPSALDAQVVTGDQEGGKGYKILLSGFRDVHGNPLFVTSETDLFSGSAEVDTTLPSIKQVNVADSARNVPATDSIRFSFSEAVLRSPLEGGIRLADSIDRTVAGDFFWRNSIEVAFVPRPALTHGAWYTIRLVMDSVVDFGGNRYRDSLWVRRFQTEDERSLSSISGTIADEMPGGLGAIHLTATEVTKKDVRPRHIVIAAPGPFSIDNIREGLYTLSAFRDSDGDGIYSYGHPFPFRTSERFVIYPDTVKVRARWPLEGVKVQFR